MTYFQSKHISVYSLWKMVRWLKYLNNIHLMDRGANVLLTMCLFEKTFQCQLDWK